MLFFCKRCYAIYQLKFKFLLEVFLIDKLAILLLNPFLKDIMKLRNFPEDFLKFIFKK